jgi:tetratricopeptide (TPR) repeat protein
MAKLRRDKLRSGARQKPRSSGSWSSGEFLRIILTALAKRRLALIGLLALAIRLIYLAELRQTAFFAVVIGDGKEYDRWAQQIAAGHWIGSEIFYQSPSYPYFLAFIFAVAGHHLMAARVIQAILGAISCVLLGYAAKEFFNQRAGIIAALLLAIYPPAIFFDGLIQKSSLDLFLVTALLAVLAKFQRQPIGKWLAVAGIALGALIVNRENARVFYPVLLGWLLIYFRTEGLRTRLRWAAILTIFTAAVLLPIALRNYYVGKEFLISTSQLGPNLYIGNHPGAQGSYEPLVAGHGNADFERNDARQLAEQAAGKPLSPSQVSAYWVSVSVHYIRHQPLSWLRLLGRKLLLTFNAREAVDTESIEAYSQYAIILRALGWINFGLIFSLAAVGAWLTREHWRRLSLLYAMVLGMALAVAIFYVVARYRYPLVPFVILFAAAALSSIPKVRTLAWRQLLAGILVAIGAAILSYWPLKTLGDDTLLNVGEELIRINRPNEAIPLLEKFANTSTNSAEAHYNLGLAFRQTRQPDAAMNEFASAIGLRAKYFEAHVAMALTLEDRGMPLGALDEFQTALHLQPNNAPARVSLADLLSNLGRTSEAISEYQQAATIAPNLFEAHYRLAQAYVRAGQLAEAIDSLQRALAIANAQGRVEDARQIQTAIDAARARVAQAAGTNH